MNVDRIYVSRQAYIDRHILPPAILSQSLKQQPQLTKCTKLKNNLKNLLAFLSQQQMRTPWISKTIRMSKLFFNRSGALSPTWKLFRRFDDILSTLPRNPPIMPRLSRICRTQCYHQTVIAPSEKLISAVRDNSRYLQT